MKNIPLKIGILIVLYLALFGVNCGGGGGDSGGGESGNGNHIISGTVTDKDERGLKDVYVSAYGVSTTTNASGGFTLNQDSVPSDRLVVNFQRSGFYDASVGSQINPNGKTIIKVVMIEKRLVGVLDNKSGGSLSEEKLDIYVAPNTFVNMDGSYISGRVNIYASYLDPDEEYFGQAMPGGDFLATNTDGENGILTSFGAIMIEAEGSTKVLINKQIYTCIDIPLSLQSKAPERIDLWGLRRSNSIWETMTTAQKNGSQYCFYIDQTGSINCDIFTRSAIVKGQICNDKGESEEGVTVRVNQIATASGGDGFYSMLVPSGSSLTVSSKYGTKAIPNVEAEESYTANLGKCAGDKPDEGYDNPNTIPGGCNWTFRVQGDYSYSFQAGPLSGQQVYEIIKQSVEMVLPYYDTESCDPTAEEISDYDGIKVEGVIHEKCCDNYGCDVYTVTVTATKICCN